MTLSTETQLDLSRYAEDGFVIVKDALSPDEVAGLRKEAAIICRGDRGAVDGLEPAEPGESDDAAMRRYVAINFPHKVSPVLQEAMRHPLIVDVLTRVIGPNVKAIQSMLFMKAEGKAGQAWHQDEHFIPTRDRSLTGVWIDRPG